MKNLVILTFHYSQFIPNRRLIVYEAGSGNRSKKLEGFSIPLDDVMGLMPWVARNGKTVLANDVSKDDRYMSILHCRPKTHSLNFVYRLSSMTVWLVCWIFSRTS
jgi:hypothetical protein